PASHAVAGMRRPADFAVPRPARSFVPILLAFRNLASEFAFEFEEHLGVVREGLTAVWRRAVPWSGRIHQQDLFTTHIAVTRLAGQLASARESIRTTMQALDQCLRSQRRRIGVASETPARCAEFPAADCIVRGYEHPSNERASTKNRDVVSPKW